MMRGGRITHDGAKQALLTDAILTEAFEAPVALETRNGWYFTRPDV